MRKNYYYFIAVLLISPLSVFSQLTTNTCLDASTTAGEVAAPTWEDGSEVNYISKEAAVVSLNFDLSQEAVGWQGTNDYAIVVTSEGLDEDELVQCIRGVTSDGVFDFSFGTDEIICADYNFWGFGYNKSEMVELGANQFVSVLYPCLDGVTDIDQVLNCFLADPEIVNSNSCITIEEVIELADSITNLLPLTLCLSVEDEAHTIGVGIEELSTISSAKVFPNPANDHLIIQLNSLINSKASFRIIDIFGRELIKEDLNIQQGESGHQFNLEALPSGTYLLNLQIGEESNTQKIQVSR